MRLRPKDLTCTSTSPGASIGLGTSSIKRASAGPCWPRMSAPVLVIKDMPGSGQSNLLIAFIMLSPKIEYQSQEESVVTIQIEDTLVSCSAIGTDGADSLLTRDPVSAVSYVLLMYSLIHYMYSDIPLMASCTNVTYSCVTGDGMSPYHFTQPTMLIQHRAFRKAELWRRAEATRHRSAATTH